MEQRTVEIVLGYYRKKYGLSQEEVCEGICSVTTLCRLEQGYREIDSLMGEALLGRIGKEVTLFETMLNEEDYILWKRRDEIKNLVENKKFTEAEKKVNEYRKLMPPEHVHEQFCLYQEALLVFEKKQIAAFTDTLEKAIKLTIPEFGTMIPKKRLYNSTEIEMILFLLHHKHYSVDVAENILTSVLLCVNEYYEQQNKEKIGTKIYLELIESMHDNSIKVLEYATKGIKLIGQGNGYWHLADFYFVKAKAEESCYRQTEEWSVYQKKCITDCEMAYHLFEIEENRIKQEEVQKFCEEKLECQIIEREMLLD